MKLKNLSKTTKVCADCGVLFESQINLTLQIRCKVCQYAGRKSDSTAYQRRQRTAVLKFLGGSCTVCGNSDRRVLQVDHINGGGSRERREYKQVRFFNQILRGERSDVQLLCANCHAIKTWNPKYEE